MKLIKEQVVHSLSDTFVFFQRCNKRITTLLLLFAMFLWWWRTNYLKAIWLHMDPLDLRDPYPFRLIHIRSGALSAISMPGRGFGQDQCIGLSSWGPCGFSMDHCIPRHNLQVYGQDIQPWLKLLLPSCKLSQTHSLIYLKRRKKHHVQRQRKAYDLK